MKALILTLALTSPALAEMPEFTRLACDFDAVEGVADARAIDVVPDGTSFRIADGADNQPALMADGDPENGLYGLAWMGEDGANVLLSFTDSGEAELSRHFLTGEEGLMWTTQIGRCSKEAN
ncbi:hypothetical protein [Stagnihabitans tardus]|uniref:C-type lysozyme inhibitor domain-containing protein n=1 Tax=Stagnihabitans tardus TaxID=2699202 RepID=A0AAE4YGK3_9RHOB|nr:hypothetical protein [Stagnihabitans tardus]NBZ89744.1 hypothetical protein [Stagnihabitans tardus]